MIDQFRDAQPGQLGSLLSQLLMTDLPSPGFEQLRDSGVLARVLPELDALFGIPQSADEPETVDVGHHQLRMLDEVARRKAALPVRWAALLHKLGKAGSPKEFLPGHLHHERRGAPLAEAICDRFGLDAETRDLALLTVAECDRIHRAVDMRAGAITMLITRLEGLERPERFERLLLIATCDFHAYPGQELKPYGKADKFRRAMRAAASIDAARFAASHPGLSADDVAQRLLEARAQAVAEALSSEQWDAA
ncbi:HD domain-containing protein [Derxia lacustris]|uniref:HD domain-containing protein n=1 Tax=Derxia lacustris TaxID=764842 RepID=UPI000A16F219|nr:HD domain-containing protein [Derxia lacustris]